MSSWWWLLLGINTASFVVVDALLSNWWCCSAVSPTLESTSIVFGSGFPIDLFTFFCLSCSIGPRMNGSFHRYFGSRLNRNFFGNGLSINLCSWILGSHGKMAKINISRRKHWKTIHPPNHKKIIRRCHQAMPYFNFNASLKTVGKSCCCYYSIIHAMGISVDQC